MGSLEDGKTTTTTILYSTVLTSSRRRCTMPTAPRAHDTADTAPRTYYASRQSGGATRISDGSHSLSVAHSQYIVYTSRSQKPSKEAHLRRTLQLFCARLFTFVTLVLASPACTFYTLVPRGIAHSLRMNIFFKYVLYTLIFGTLSSLFIAILSLPRP
jgi:hypothetical protein